MTEEKPDNSASAAADDERWLTYLNYDQNIQQAVRRLGALSSAYVDEFRAILLKGRDRTRIKEYEAETIRRLQGEAFVGDEELQLALVVLNAEDPHLGDELKRLVSRAGRPPDLDSAMAAIRAQKGSLPRQDREKAEAPHPVKAEEPLPVQQVAPAPQVHQPRPEKIDSVKIEPVKIEPVKIDPVKIEEPSRKPQAAAEIFPLGAPQEIQKSSRAKRFAMLGAILVIGAAGLVLIPKFLTGNPQTGNTPTVNPQPSNPETSNLEKSPVLQTAAPSLRPAAPEDKPVVQPAPPSGAAQRAPSVKIAMPVPNKVQQPGVAPSVAEADKNPLVKNGSQLPAVASPTAAPVPGASYKVVRGDMLTQIALEAYGDASKFVLIQKANPNLRNGPDRIYFDQVIFIPPSP